jgi:transcriptional regulator with XRE-family HTH domain
MLAASFHPAIHLELKPLMRISARLLSPCSVGKSQSRIMPAKAPDPMDVHVGKRLRMRRLMLDMSQEQLGEALNLTFQQIQKYEKGANRVGASRLRELSSALQVPIEFFFEGGPRTTSSAVTPSSAAPIAGVWDFLASSEGLALTRAFTRIQDAELRRCIVDLVEQIAAGERD